MVLKKPLNFGGKSILEKIDEIKQEQPVATPPSSDEIEVIDLKQEIASSTQIERVMKQYRLTKKTVGIRFDLEEDVNMELDILCIKNGINKKDFLLDAVKEAIRKEKRKFEK